MRTFTRTTLAALAALLFARAASAQAPDAWVRHAPEREGFVALMPAPPTAQDVRVEAGGLKVAGRSYVATGDEQATFMVLALDDPSEAGERLIAANKDYPGERFRGEAVYLDAIAEVAWEVLVRPEFERGMAESFKSFYPNMDYRREFELAGLPAREYLVKLEKAHGPVYVCADGSRFYVVAALGPAFQWPQLTRFVESFSPKASAPARPEEPAGAGAGPGRGGNVGGVGGDGGAGGGEIDYNRVFSPKDVGRKAVVTLKPDPGFTEGARKFTVTGVVRIRAVLDRTGVVTNIAVVKGLPHGLTKRAVNAARGVRFNPAQKDGRAVSQFITFEYNFNIY